MKKTCLRRGDVLVWAKDNKTVSALRGTNSLWWDVNQNAIYVPYIESEGVFFDFVSRIASAIGLKPEQAKGFKKDCAFCLSPDPVP
jgi:hypothetical protein